MAKNIALIRLGLPMRRVELGLMLLAAHARIDLVNKDHCEMRTNAVNLRWCERTGLRRSSELEVPL
jgi:hypothetical protein